MRMSIICCPFKTSFGSYASSLKTALEKKTGETVQWVASNCGCGDSMEVSRKFELPKTQYEYFEMPLFCDYPARTAWKGWLRSLARGVLLSARGKRYASLTKNAEVVHFQQILNAFGSKAVFSWLQQTSTASRIVTVHELDAEQLRFPKTNEIYNRANAIIVHCEEMRQDLIRLGVQKEKLHVVFYGTTLPTPPPEDSREDLVFYAGHKVMSGKGIETLFKAILIIHQKMGARAPILKIHGHYGSIVPPEALQLAAEYGMDGKIVWLNQLPDEETARLYQQSLLCVLPYTGSFGGAAASMAAACRLPIVGTRKAGLPDYLGETGVWVDENNPEQLADKLMELLNNEPARRQLGEQLLKRAEAFLQWDVIADQTLKIYAESLHQKDGRELKPSYAA